MIWLLVIPLFMAGLMFPPDTLTEGVGSLLVTFLGLMAAGIIPAMSLLVANTLSPSFSVKRLDVLKSDVSLLIEKLWQTLGFVMVGACFVIIAQFNLPKIPSTILSYNLPDWLQQAPDRLIQAGAISCFIVALDRLRVVKTSFLAVFEQRFEMARKDSELRTRENVNKMGRGKDYFPKSKEFGPVTEVIPERASS